MTLPHNPHDAFFKQLFTRPEAAEDFVRHYLPENITTLLKPGSLTICKDSFIDEALAEHYSDLLYRIQLKHGEDLYAYLLFEHKSAPKPRIALDLLRYMVRIWDFLDHQDHKAKLPLILPLVIYHGRKRWRVAQHFSSLFDLPEAFAPYFPEYRYLLTDLSRYSDEEIKGELVLRLGLGVLKYIFRGELPAQLSRLLTVLPDLIQRQGGLEFLETVLRYLSTAAPQLGEEDLQRAVTQALPDGERIMATIAEKWEERGLQRGVEQGERQFLLSMVRRRFGEDVARQTQKFITNYHERSRLEELGGILLECGSGEAWLEQLRATTK